MFFPKQEREKVSRNNLVKRAISTWLVTSMVLLPIQSAMVKAAMVPTESAIASAGHEYRQQQILDRVRSEDARQALQSLGVAPADVEKRVAVMTPDELAQFNRQVQELPAGGSSIFGVVIFILVLLIVLDLLGATDIFPVIKPIGSYN
jgi:hypothetical protein